MLRRYWFGQIAQNVSQRAGEFFGWFDGWLHGCAVRRNFLFNRRLQIKRSRRFIGCHNKFLSLRGADRAAPKANEIKRLHTKSKGKRQKAKVKRAALDFFFGKSSEAFGFYFCLLPFEICLLISLFSVFRRQ
jgi:hypothetical protein